jgi:hypothetical protein
MTVMATVLQWMSNLDLCIFKHTFGVPCPGCGMTRAFIHFFHLDLKGAFYYHPLFFLVPIIFGIYLFRKKLTFFEKLCKNNYLVGGVLGLFLIVYLYRMSLFFPSIPPMDYNEQSVAASVFHWVVSQFH